MDSKESLLQSDGNAMDNKATHVMSMAMGATMMGVSPPFDVYRFFVIYCMNVNCRFRYITSVTF